MALANSDLEDQLLKFVQHYSPHCADYFLRDPSPKRNIWDLVGDTFDEHFYTSCVTNARLDDWEKEFSAPLELIFGPMIIHHFQNRWCFDPDCNWDTLSQKVFLRTKQHRLLMKLLFEVSEI